MTEEIHPYFEDEDNIPPARSGVVIPTPSNHMVRVGCAAAMCADVAISDRTEQYKHIQTQNRKKPYTRAR